MKIRKQVVLQRDCGPFAYTRVWVPLNAQIGNNDVCVCFAPGKPVYIYIEAEAFLHEGKLEKHRNIVTIHMINAMCWDDMRLEKGSCEPICVDRWGKN